MINEVLFIMINVSKLFFGVKVLDYVNLMVKLYSVYVLMGENGVGKLIFLKCLFGIYVKDEGEILFLGKFVNFKIFKEVFENGILMVY